MKINRKWGCFKWCMQINQTSLLSFESVIHVLLLSCCGPQKTFGHLLKGCFLTTGGYPAGLYDEREQRWLHRPLQWPRTGALCHRTDPPTSSRGLMQGAELVTVRIGQKNVGSAIDWQGPQQPLGSNVCVWERSCMFVLIIVWLLSYEPHPGYLNNNLKKKTPVYSATSCTEKTRPAISEQIPSSHLYICVMSLSHFRVCACACICQWSHGLYVLCLCDFFLLYTTFVQNPLKP